MQQNKMLDRLVQATIKTMGRVQTKGGWDKWPLPKCHIWDCEIYCAPFLLEQLYNYLQEAEKQGLSNQDIARLYKYPSYFARLFFLFVFRPLANLNHNQMKELGLKIAEILNVFYKGKIQANLYRENILWNKKELSKNLKNLQFQKIDQVEEDQLCRKLISQIKGKLYLYTELVYNNYPNFGYEIHGPYNLGQQNLLVREYHDLKPDFWNFNKGLPFKEITIYETYKRGKVKAGIDMHGRLFVSKPLSLNINKFAIIVDKTLVVKGLKDLAKISQILDNFLNKGAQEKASLKKGQIIKKFAWNEFVLLKPLAKKLGRDWRPPKRLLDKINKSYLTKKEKTYLRLIFTPKIGLRERFDPRIPINFSQK